MLIGLSVVVGLGLLLYDILRPTINVRIIKAITLRMTLCGETHTAHFAGIANAGSRRDEKNDVTMQAHRQTGSEVSSF